jgi:hypothetical protein
MAAGRYNFTIEQHATFSRTLTFRDSTGALINMTPYTAKLQARVSPDSATPTINWTIALGNIVMGGAAGTIQWKATAIETGLLSFETIPYDFVVYDATGTVWRRIEGMVTLSKGIAR